MTLRAMVPLPIAALGARPDRRLPLAAIGRGLGLEALAHLTFKRTAPAFGKRRHVAERVNQVAEARLYLIAALGIDPKCSHPSFLSRSALC